MKTISFFILIILLCACGKSNHGKTISLIQYDNAINKLSPTADLHKDKDVELFISQDENRIIYSCIMYRIENGELKGYQIYATELNTYDKANYQWVNDSTMTFTLSNEYRNSKTFKVTGYAGTTALAWE
ncbi:hypothetical protein [Lutibacter sp.]|uniref:hypothetical protein n=1 Tax=Lutibacter sp. TaxID=1925666 RepID=UPI00356A2AE4